jgi:hypothetical protein
LDACVLIARLVRAGGLPTDVAIGLGERIEEANPTITPEIIARFRALLGR